MGFACCVSFLSFSKKSRQNSQFYGLVFFVAIKLRIWFRFIDAKERHTIKRHTHNNNLTSTMPLTLTKEQMDDRCVTIKNVEFCKGCPKKTWQERYLSFNPTVAIEDLVNMHTYEMFYYLEGEDEKEEDLVEMTDGEQAELLKASEQALISLDEYRKENKEPVKPAKKKRDEENAATKPLKYEEEEGRKIFVE